MPPLYKEKFAKNRRYLIFVNVQKWKIGLLTSSRIATDGCLSASFSVLPPLVHLVLPATLPLMYCRSLSTDVISSSPKTTTRTPWQIRTSHSLIIPNLLWVGLGWQIRLQFDSITTQSGHIQFATLFWNENNKKHTGLNFKMITSVFDLIFYTHLKKW